MFRIKEHTSGRQLQHQENIVAHAEQIRLLSGGLGLKAQKLFAMLVDLNMLNFQSLQ